MREAEIFFAPPPLVNPRGGEGKILTVNSKHLASCILGTSMRYTTLNLKGNKGTILAALVSVVQLLSFGVQNGTPCNKISNII